MISDYMKDGEKWVCYRPMSDIFVAGETYIGHCSDAMFASQYYLDAKPNTLGRVNLTEMISGNHLINFIPLAVCNEKLLFKSRLSGDFADFSNDSYEIVRGYDGLRGDLWR